MSALSNLINRDTAVKIVVYCAVAMWLTFMGQTVGHLSDIAGWPIPLSLLLINPIFLVLVVVGAVLFTAIARIARD
jgi:hypothetical protein